MATELSEHRREYLKEYRRTHREQQRKYTQAWRAANPDKVAVYNARYWARKVSQQAGAVQGE